MSSYEEMVVDRSVDAAWLEFRVRVADHLAAMEPGERLRLGLPHADDELDYVLIRCRGNLGLTATWDWVDEADRPGARNGRPLRIGPDRIDAFALRVARLLKAEGAHHPSFVDVLGGDLMLVDPPREIAAPAGPPALPESVTPTTHDDLVGWVDRVLTKRLGRTPNKRDDGSIGISRDDERLTIRISSSRPIIEVWATVAKGVDVRKARKILPKLNATFHFFSFALVGDRVVVSTTVNAKPFCPEHLDRAIDSTFTYLAGEAGELRSKVVRKAPKKSASVDNAIDADLLLVYGAASDRKAMVRLARDLTGDSRTSLGQWRGAAIEAGKTAKQRASEVDNGPVQNALIEQYIAWKGVAGAITDAVEEIVYERRAA